MADRKGRGKAGTRTGRSRKSTTGQRAGSEAQTAPAGDHDALTRNLATSIVAPPLLEALENARSADRLPVIIDLNLLHPQGLDYCKAQAETQIATLCRRHRRKETGADPLKSRYSPQYLFALLSKKQLLALVSENTGELRASEQQPPRLIYKLWPDFEVQALLTRSAATVKADAARISFSAEGDGICWAVIDSGIDGTHPHFAAHGNLRLEQAAPLQHMDFTGAAAQAVEVPEDPYGHGTHVAGIIAGEGLDAAARRGAYRRFEPATGDVSYAAEADVGPIAGIAPKTRLLSLRTLDEFGQGRVSSLIAALGYVATLNEQGRWLRVHGVNLSVGYEFDAEWFACGQSPLCVEVDRLVRSGVSVVVAAGNTGYGNVSSQAIAQFKTALDLTINDPGNAELALTVGATHRDSPHQYGVSYFSSKGPTGDGRAKPDLVAPGEKIMSCAAGKAGADIGERVGERVQYREESGTSMAAPHVSGAIAAFMSVRREFRGRPEALKKIFMDSATDLGRDRYFQGRGVLDLMRAIQSV
ncbi:MAG: S8 family peptidase [Pseudomonadota bacterium]